MKRRVNINKKAIAFKTIIVWVILIALIIVVLVLSSDATKAAKEAILKFFGLFR